MDLSEFTSLLQLLNLLATMHLDPQQHQNPKSQEQTWTTPSAARARPAAVELARPAVVEGALSIADRERSLPSYSLADAG